MDQDSGEPSDQLSEHAQHLLKDIGSKSTTVTQVLETKDEVIYKDIQAGLDRANQRAISNAQKVGHWANSVWTFIIIIIYSQK